MPAPCPCKLAYPPLSWWAAVLFGTARSILDTVWRGPGVQWDSVIIFLLRTWLYCLSITFSSFTHVLFIKIPFSHRDMIEFKSTWEIMLSQSKFFYYFMIEK